MNQHEEDYYYPGGYEALLLRIGNVVLCQSFGSYDGDYYVLFKEGDRYGYLTFGYGSCSGCDALEACRSQEDEDRLQQRLTDSIFWGTAKEVVDRFLESGDRNEFYYYYPQDFVAFAEKVIDLTGLNKLDFPVLLDLKSENEEATSNHQ